MILQVALGASGTERWAGLSIAVEIATAHAPGRLVPWYTVSERLPCSTGRLVESRSQIHWDLSRLLPSESDLMLLVFLKDNSRRKARSIASAGDFVSLKLLLDLEIQQVSCEDIPYKGSFQRTKLAVRSQFAESTQELLQSFFGLLFSCEKGYLSNVRFRTFSNDSYILTMSLKEHVSRLMVPDCLRRNLTTFGPNGKEQEITDLRSALSHVISPHMIPFARALSHSFSTLFERLSSHLSLGFLVRRFFRNWRFCTEVASEASRWVAWGQSELWHRYLPWQTELLWRSRTILTIPREALSSISPKTPRCLREFC